MLCTSLFNYNIRYATSNQLSPGFIYCDFYDSAKGSSPPSHHLIQSNAKGRVPIVVVKASILEHKKSIV